MKRQYDMIDNGYIPASYVIFNEKNTVYARNGTTLKIDFKGKDSAAIMRSTMNNVNSGEKIFIRNATYDMTDTFIYNKDNIVIEGEGQGTVLRLADGANADVLSAARRNNRGIIIRNLTIDGNKQNNTSGRGLVFTGYYSYLDNINIRNCAENGFDAEVSTVSGENMVDNIVNNIRINNCGKTGFIWGTNTGGVAADNYFQNIISFGNGGEGIDFIPGSIYGWNFNSYSNVGNGIVVRGGGNRLVACESSDNGKNGYLLYRNGGFKTTLVGCRSWNNSKSMVGAYHGFHMDGDGVNTQFRTYIIGCTAHDEAIVKTQGWGIKQSYATSDTRSEVIGGSFFGIPGGINVTDQLLVTGIREYMAKGIFITSGTGVQKTFNIPHGLVVIPTYVDLSAKSLDATGNKYWNADVTNIIVNFVTPPPLGNNNIIIGWKAEV